MKKAPGRIWRFRDLSFIFLFSFLLISCEFYNFSHPQPYDKEKLYKFPEEIQGKWEVKDSLNAAVDATLPLNGEGGGQYNNENGQLNKKRFSYAEEDSSMYCIYSDYIILVNSARKKILAGEWPKRNEKNEIINLPDGFEGQKEIRYDSLNNPVDTINRYIISNNRIYTKNQDRYLDKGYEFIRIRDTITVLQNDSICIDLGQNAFLCKLSDSFYVFNINNSILALGESENWWRLVILEITGNGKINQWECSSKTGRLSCMFYERPSKYEQFYFDCRWSAADMLVLIREGYFERNEIMYRINR